jgi:diguanylate cyclase (GGDEF)-like protein
VGGSVGISIFPDDSNDLEKLIKQADEAMYLAKQCGKNTYKFYRDALREQPGE